MPTSEQIEKAAFAIMIEDECGLTVDGKRVLCDDAICGKHAEVRCVCRNQARAALTAAEVKPRVKPLVWVEASFGDTWYAKSILGEYAIWEIGDGYFRAPDHQAGRKCNGDLEAAKAAAQADYEARIRSALTTEGE